MMCNVPCVSRSVSVVPGAFQGLRDGSSSRVGSSLQDGPQAAVAWHGKEQVAGAMEL